MHSPVQTRQQLIDLIRTHASSIRELGVEKIGVFGSFARDEIRPDSDVDLFVEFDHARKSLQNFIRLGDLFEELTQRKVEIVTPQSLSKYIGPKILQSIAYVSIAA
jgi:uncharacterized protein